MTANRSACWVFMVKTDFPFYMDKKKGNTLRIYIAYKDLKITRFTCVLSISV